MARQHIRAVVAPRTRQLLAEKKIAERPRLSRAFGD